MSVEGEILWPTAGQGSIGVIERRLVANFPLKLAAQEKSNWCWAAVCQAIAACHGRMFSQTQIVQICTPGKEQLNEPGYPITAAIALGATVNEFASEDFLEKVPQSCTIHAVIIVVAANAQGSLAHAVCAFGTAVFQGEQALVIYDPWPPHQGAGGEDLIKIVTLKAISSAYSPGDSKGRRGRWQRAAKVTAFQR
jgi:hypothetical protein